VARIERLRISGLRNLSGVDVRLPASVGWLVGENGAGKTSLLEAVYLLSRGSSFRGRRFGPLVTRGAGAARIDALVTDSTGRWTRRLVIPSRGGTQSAGRSFYVRLIGASMQLLLEGEPGLRRRFVDWNLFHVEHRFQSVRARYRRVAAQRNAWLKGGGGGKPVWDLEYASVLSEIAALRAHLLGSLARAFQQVARNYPAAQGLSLEWRSGLPAAVDIPAWLDSHLDADIARGYSFLSSARGDFHFFQDSMAWVGSRGENKLVGILLQLAAEQVVFEQIGERAVWLIDDLGAELDRATQEKLLAQLINAGDQALVTSLDEPAIPTPQARTTAVFHVEHGAVAQTDPAPDRSE